jgi:hypothetical protein
MNLNLLKSSNETKVQTNEKYPHLPVLTLLAEGQDKTKSTKMIKFNINSLSTMNVGGIGRESHNRIVTFKEYLVSNPGEEDRYDMVIFATDQKVIKANKNYKSYEIALGTRKCMTSEIYDMLVERFGFDSSVDNYLQLIPTNERTGGAFTFSIIGEVNQEQKQEEVVVEESNEEEFIVNDEDDNDIIFDKGNDVDIHMFQF